MDALKPFNSKYITLTMRGGFFTKFATLAHGAAAAAAAAVHLEESLKRKSFWPEGILFWSR
jgi:hypothetical protein